jgi:NRAMP (natural resistance-associated macrophage protein)-like metal ion transporter
MKKIIKFLKSLGPGFITGASDDDPSGIGTYSQTGAQFGYNQLWTAPFSFPFMTVIQEMCGRIGMVTGRGLSGVIKRHYARPILYGAVSLLFIANTINIGANLGAMASSIQLLVDVPFVVLLLAITVSTVLLEVYVPYPAYARILKYLTLSLFAYIIAVFVIKQDWQTIAISTLLPQVTFSKEYLMNIVAILGTTISPYLFFWQADQEVEEEIAHHKIRAIGKGIPRITHYDIRKMRIDTIIGMFFSNIVMFFIIATTASTLHVNNITVIETADQAASALRPLAGDFAFLLFTLGIVGTGFLAIPVLAGSASYALSEAVGWNAGLNKKFSRAHGFYLVIAFATLGGLLVNFTPIKPFQLLYYTAILNGCVAPVLMIILLLISNNKKIMGEHTNSLFSNILGITITCIMLLASLLLLLSIFV